MKQDTGTIIPIQELIDEALAKIAHRQEHREDLPGIGSGFYDLDALTGGFMPSTLTVLGARPSMGKTAFTLNIARHVCVDLTIPVAIFSFEICATQLMQRLLTSGARVDANRLRTGHVRDEDWTKMRAEADLLRDAPLVIDDTQMAFMTLAERCRQLHERQHGLKLIIIDDLQQLLAAEFGTARDDNQPYLTDCLKTLAKELDVAIVATSQLHYKLEFRKSKRPILTDLKRGAYGISTPDIILFLYRDEYYNPESDYRGEAELIIARQKNGPVGTAELIYHPATNNFFNKVHTGGGGLPLELRPPKVTDPDYEIESITEPEEFPLEGG